jgi:hypothetical protein
MQRVEEVLHGELVRALANNQGVASTAASIVMCSSSALRPHTLSAGIGVGLQTVDAKHLAAK